MNPRGRARVLMIGFACGVVLVLNFVPSQENKILFITLLACVYFAGKFLLLKKKFAPEKK